MILMNKYAAILLMSLALFFLDFSKKSYGQNYDLLHEKAPSFQLKDLQGASHSLDEMKGKVVLLDFWATWCAPCIKSFPAMQEIQELYANEDDVVFWYINSLEAEGRTDKFILNFLAQRGLDLFVLRDTATDESVAGIFGITGLPAKIIINKSGKISYMDAGYSGSAEAFISHVVKYIEEAR